MKLLTPDYVLNTVYDFNIQELYDKGFRVILSDLDNTLAPWDSEYVSVELKQWIDKIQGMNMKIILLSNAEHQRVEKFCKELNIEGIGLARKPLGTGFKKAIKQLGAKKEEVLMIGDQVFTDVLGAKLQSIAVALVKPLSEKELTITKLIRHLEKPIRTPIETNQVK